MPVLLSTPSHVDLTVDPEDLADRLERYAAADAPALEADLLLALTRLDTAATTPAVLDRLRVAEVPVVGQDGDALPFVAGPAAAAYATDPVVEPPLVREERWECWRAGEIVLPRSLRRFPRRLDTRGYTGPDTGAVFPAWSDAAAEILAHSNAPALGVALRQAARRATPFGPASAIALLGSQRRVHDRAAEDASAAVLEAWDRGLLRPGVADASLLDLRTTPRALAAFAAATLRLADEGLASVVWPVLDDLLAISLSKTRLLAGTAELAEAMLAIAPDAAAAVVSGVAGPEVLAVRGLRALAARPGSSRAVVAAREAAALLPPAPGDAAGASPAPAAAPAPANAPADFDAVWPADLATLPALDDGVAIAASWQDPDAPTKLLALDLRLPADPGRVYRVVKVWSYDLESEGQCAAVVRAEGEEPGARDHYRSEPGTEAWLAWDPEAGRLRAHEHRNRTEGTGGPLRMPPGGIPPLSTALHAVALSMLCHDGDAGVAGEHVVRDLIERGGIGWAGTRLAARALVTQPTASPARMVRLVERRLGTLPALWPVLTEAVAAAGATDGPLPRWLPRVLDVAAASLPYLAEASRRGLVPADAAAFPGLEAIAARAGRAVGPAKARALLAAVEAQGLTRAAS
ncbi:DUF6493 family protein [Isoptericola sp. NPDC057191]|uniref:DUF7824 domain-containing protein n=1 Tax=Isoptericola sp. NPDC057191 TaxID=3346041 RepID=UPI0036253D74